MNSSQFKKNEFKRLCSTIGFKPLEVEGLIAQMDKYYKEWVEKKVDSKTGNPKRYKDGTIKERVIRPSLGELKIIQKNIKNRILATIELPDSVHGGVKKRSNISNAKPHQGNKYQFTTDLQDFYPSINAQRVYDTFIHLKFSPHYAHWLTKLTTWKHELPQGTPTSTHLANLVFLSTDMKLIEVCNKHMITYTRYVDDLTFSSQQDFRHLLNTLLDIVTSSGFKLSYRKTKYKGNQTITGINVYLNKIDAPEKIIQKSKAEIERKSDTLPFTNYLNNIRKTNTPKKKKTNKKGSIETGS
ncbi:reverse transcriptase family protein [Lacibacter sp.]|uniref:reverse transcriptase family protein n=1 Tax=Lacibacter sp. TaxID=1915409 RepID=UPI002B4B01F3|nr:reverse transcriptase family protein [Lacibacter sp.]HLP39011.1 reverse transcriptase family protein [Lacibacter sp.]